MLCKNTKVLNEGLMNTELVHYTMGSENSNACTEKNRQTQKMFSVIT